MGAQPAQRCVLGKDVAQCRGRMRSNAHKLHEIDVSCGGTTDAEDGDAAIESGDGKWRSESAAQRVPGKEPPSREGV